jgi:signal transduction histidine kinase
VSPSTRLLAYAGAAALAIGLSAAGCELAVFGPTPADTSRHLESAVRQQFAAEASSLETMAEHVAGEADRIAAATSSRDELTALFADLAAVTQQARDARRISANVYVPSGPAGEYRVLAWSDGPAASLRRDRLNGPRAFFAAPGGPSGTRLVFVQPVERDGRRIAVVTAETILASSNRLDTRFGPVTFLSRYEGAGAAEPPAHGFIINSPTGAPLLEVHVEPDEIAARRAAFRRRGLAAAALPLAVALLWFLGPVLERRRHAAHTTAWIAWSIAALAVLGAATAALMALVTVLGAPAPVGACLASSALFAAAVLVPGTWWWRSRSRHQPAAEPIRFAIEHLLVGVALAAVIALIAHILSSRITPLSLDRWQSALFPFSVTRLIDIWSVLILDLALCWGVASLLAGVALRWRLMPPRPATAAAIALWLAPALVMQHVPAGRSIGWPAGLPVLPAFGMAAAAIVFALAARRLRRYYRRTTESMRLWLGLLALIAPLVTIYPMAAFIADRTARDVIQAELAPAVAGQPEQLIADLVQAERDIDRLASLADLVRDPRPFEYQTAFFVWTQTSLSRTRVTSDIELYGPNRGLISRFALNFPEYLNRAPAWSGSGCTWSVSGEVTRFGAADRAMLHAERGICDADGRLVGAVVVHVAPRDYQALPFLPSQNPYYDLLNPSGEPARAAEPRLPDLQLVVYGWSLQPIFVSDTDRAAWSISPALFQQLYGTGAPFWATLETDGRPYRVYFSQNRAGIYALGYPVPGIFDHATRLAELAALTVVLFLVIQIAAALSAPFSRRPAALRRLYQEVRTSFYRKLFLFFVVAAVGPVLVFALAFGAYMSAKFRADVEAEARSVVSVAQRVFEQVASAEQPPGQPPVQPSDDVMVWIRQVIDQDVNLFDGPELVATSQRDLFNQHLLPTRTPASVYRTIALERLPTYVAEDRLGPSPYLVAAAPVPARGPDAVLTVPLAPRQREIERELDELDRGVLVGSVFVVLFAAALGAWLASRIADPVARLTRATRQIAAGRLDVRIVADTADELRRLVDNFNSMTATLVAQRAELARTNQLKAWNEMARQVAHEIKNPLTPIQLAAEHLHRVHEDHGRPLGAVLDQCVDTVLGQVRLLRRIASEFANFAGEPTPRIEAIDLGALVDGIVDPYRVGLAARIAFSVDVPANLPAVRGDRTLLSRALTNLVENAVQAMPAGGDLRVSARRAADGMVELTLTDTGVGMDETAVARAFEPYFSTKTSGSGLGLANARRNLELLGGRIALASRAGEGTTITVCLPAAPAPPDAAATAPAPSR